MPCTGCSTSIRSSQPLTNPSSCLWRSDKDAYQRIDAAPDEFLDDFARAQGGAPWRQIQGRRFVEPFAVLTFFTVVIPSLLPRATFIYILRHPASVMTSGMRRRWCVDHEARAYRMVPRGDDPVDTR